MEWLHVVVLAVVQGLTEFLPISSSAHLILVPQLLGWPDQGLAFDVAVHVGTLMAVLTYFRHEVSKMFIAWLKSFKGHWCQDARLAWGVIIATIPVGVIGLMFHDVVETALRQPVLIAWVTVVFGLLLWLADAKGSRSRNEHSLSWLDMIVIGIAQAFALMPGMSRSGITITAGLMLGLNRQGAARFSFLLSLPTILAAGSLETEKLIQAGEGVDWSVLIGGAVLSGISAYLCIHYFLKLLEKVGMTPFVIYRIVLGVYLLYVFS